MDLEVVGRHALLFDDDAMAAFVNSTDALVEWNSLLIDRYDVRHLLSAPPPPRRRRNLQQPQSSSSPQHTSIESELDDERYLDLPPPSHEQELEDGAKSVEAGGYHAVTFSYGYTDDSTDQNNADAGLEGSGFRPPFPVSDSLLQSLPPTEKVHQIIVKTAIFVSKHGGQSEIVLRVKHGDNPAFGFLMPDHQLHAYFRYLVDHQELLQSATDGKPQNVEKKDDAEHNWTDGAESGALSLLGSVYGSGEDEDGTADYAPESKENITIDPGCAAVSHGSEKTEVCANAAGKDGILSKHPLPSKEKTPLKRSSFISASKAAGTNIMKKEDDSSGSLSAAADNSRASAPGAMPKIEPLVLEPPSDLKRLVDRIVEFIMKNGKEFEAVLIEQDSKHVRFPFLLPCNKYHPYYLKVLQMTQESKIMGKNFSGKNDSVAHGQDKKASLYKENDTLSLGSADSDIPYDYDRKEKFKMVLGKSKKDGQDPPSKATQHQFGVCVDAAAAAAILQAATRGIRNPNLGFLSNTSLGNSRERSSEGGPASILGNLHSSQPESGIQKSYQNGEHKVSIPVAKAMAKTAAIEVASEADSCEAHLTREQKLKAERLKRAKMFVAMLKSGAAPFKAEPLHGLSAEPQESGISVSGANVNLVNIHREGSSAPLVIDASDKNEMSERKNCGDEQNERRSRRKYRSRSMRHEEDEEEGDEEEHSYSRKKHRSHRSSHEDDDGGGSIEKERDDQHSRKKHRSRPSSREDKEEEKDKDERDHKHTRKKHRSHHSSREESNKEEEDEERNHRHSRKKHRSHHSSHHSRDRHKHRRRHSSSKDQDSRHRHTHDSSEDEHIEDSRSYRHKKNFHLEREELEEGEINSKISDQSGGYGSAGASREASVNLFDTYPDRRAPAQPSEATEVSDDLRAKIRAMLMSTL